MTTKGKSLRERLTWIALILAIAAITAVDVAQPPGVVFAAAYIAVVVLAFVYLAPKHALIITVICILTGFVDAYTERLQESSTEESIERAMVLGSLWLVAFLMYRRQRANADLEHSQAKYQAIFDGAADGILMVDAAGTISSTNPAATSMLGYAAGELDGAPIGIIIPPEYRQAHEHSVAEYAAGRLDIAHMIGVSREVEAVRRDGTIFPIEINVSVAQCSYGRMFSAVIRDITGRRQSESTIRENQRTLATLMSNLPGMAYRCLYDDSWTMTFVSQGVITLTGFEPHEVIGNRAIPFDKIIYPADRDSVRESVRKAVDADQPYDVTYRIVHRSGEIRWVNEKGRAVPTRDGAAIVLEGFISDITREKRIAEAMRESEVRFRTIADSTPIMIWASGIDRQITFANRRILEFTGLSIDELLGDSWLSHLHPDDVDRVTREYAATFEAWQPFEIEYRLRSGDGQYRWVVISGVPRFAPDGDFMGYIGSGMDIHDRKIAELAIRDSESRFRMVADSSPVMIWLTTADGLEEFVNKTWLDFTGRDCSEVMGLGWTESIHPDDRKRVLDSFTQAHRTRTPWSEEYRLRRHDGVYRWILDQGIPYSTESKGYSGFSGSCFDFTERKEALEALKESESRFRSMANGSPVMIWMSGIEGKTVFANSSMRTFLGPLAISNLATCWRELVHPNDLDAAVLAYTSAVRARETIQIEYRMRRADGEWRWILDAGSPRMTEHGEYAGYIGTCYDITERKTAEVALRESEVRFRDVANLTPSIIWVAAPDATCTFINKTWLDLTGQTTEEATGHGWASAIHPDDREAARDSTMLGFETRDRYESEFRVRATDGSWRTLLNTAAPRFGKDGEFLGYIGSAIDVTDRHRLDQIISHISMGVSGATGDEFFRSLAKQLAEALSADMVCIAELSPHDPSQMNSIAYIEDGAIGPDMRYEIPGTPCAIALAEGRFDCRDQVQRRFPEDQFLIEHAIEGYIGQALKDSNGVNHGVIWVLFRRPIPDVDFAASLLRIFAVRASAEVERRQSSEALRVSEEQFRLSLRAGNFTVFRQDRELCYTWIHNPMVLSPEDIVGHTDFELLPRREAEVLTALKSAVIQSGVGGRAEVELSPGGVTRVYDLIVEPDRDPSGHVTGISCISSDVTERKRMEVSLRESEQRYRRLFEHAPIALCEYDLSGIKSAFAALEGRGVHDVIAYYKDNPDEYMQLFTAMSGASLNRQALSLFGAESENHLRETFQAIVTETLISSFGKFIGALQSGCTSFEDEVALRTVSGTHRHIIARSMLAPGHERDWSRVVTSMVDVTSQRRAEEALTRSEARYRQMFQESPMAKLEVDMSDVRDELLAGTGSRDASLTEAFDADPGLLERCLRRVRFASTNANAVRIFRAPNDVELRKNIPLLFTESTMGAFREFLIRLWGGGTTYEAETHFRTLDGEKRTGRIHCVLTTESRDDWSQVLVAILDVTESRHAEEELGRAKRLETAGRLAGQIAHDFNNLLGPLVAYPEILQAKYPAEGRAHEMLRDMQNAALQIAEINQELLTLSRRGHYNTEPLDLNSLVQSAIRTAEIPSTVALDFKRAPGELRVRGGGAQLMRVMVNLIRNAVEAMDEVGTITIATDQIYLDEPLHQYATVSRGEYARVSIGDTGCGISEDALEHIFEPFFTTKKADKKRGTGLGLPVVHSVVEDHEGYIDVASTPGIGSTFTLYFPLYRGEATANDDMSTIQEGQGESILVVDDDPLQRRIAETALDRFGYRVTVLESGEEAVRHIVDHPVDLVILDMVMGGIDGAETLRQIRELYPHQAAVILTGYSTSERAQAAMALNHCELLAKPIQISVLTSTIRRTLKAAEARNATQAI